MAQFYYSLTAKSDSLGKKEVVIRCTIGKLEMNSKSNIFVHPDFFEYVINRAKCEKEGVKLNRRIDRITKSEAEKKGIYILRHGYIKNLEVIGEYLDVPVSELLG